MWLPQGRRAPARAAPVQQLRFSSSRATQLRAKASPAGAGRSPLHFAWCRRVAKVRQRGGGPASPGWGQTGLRWENPSGAAAKPRGIISLGLKKKAGEQLCSPHPINRADLDISSSLNSRRDFKVKRDREQGRGRWAGDKDPRPRSSLSRR